MSKTPSLSEIILNGVEQTLGNLHTAMPGKIETYDEETQLANVKPLFKRKYASETEAVEMPIIINVPVIHPRTANAFVRLPVAVGDYVQLLFNERSLDRWLEKGGEVDPQDPSKFGLDGAVAIPGLNPKADAFVANGDPESVEIANGTAYVEIKEDGTIEATNGTGSVMIKDDGEILIDSGQATLQIDASGNVKITATKITLESTAVHLGDESGEALVKMSDLATLTVPGAMGGGPGLPVTNVAIGTIKTKAS
jgi:Phage protein Gp138 N-terminal domain